MRLHGSGCAGGQPGADEGAPGSYVLQFVHKHPGLHAHMRMTWLTARQASLGVWRSYSAGCRVQVLAFATSSQHVERNGPLYFLLKLAKLSLHRRPPTYLGFQLYYRIVVLSLARILNLAKLLGPGLETNGLEHHLLVSLLLEIVALSSIPLVKLPITNQIKRPIK